MWCYAEKDKNYTEHEKYPTAIYTTPPPSQEYELLCSHNGNNFLVMSDDHREGRFPWVAIAGETDDV